MRQKSQIRYVSNDSDHVLYINVQCFSGRRNFQPPQILHIAGLPGF